jgi:VanZ family protein
MRSLRYIPLWLLIGYTLVVAVVTGSLIPPPSDVVAVNDKLLHLLSYLVLALWFGFVYRRERFARIGLWLVALGVAIECLQAGTGYRSFEVADMLADAAGAGTGLLLAATPLGGTLLWTERRLPSRG